MSYEKQNFTDGEVLFAEHLNKIEEQIVVNETAIEQKADKDHTHDYANIDHVHDVYANVDHEHGIYAIIDHEHDNYAIAEHSHDEYALSDHNHDSVYDAHGASAAALDSAKSYTDEKVADLLDNSEGAIDSLLELAEVMKNNPDAIETIQGIAENKADKEHTHVIDDVTGLADTLQNKADSQHTHDSYALSDHNHYLGKNPIKLVEDDTIDNWLALGTGIATYNIDGCLNNQPYTYGLLINECSDSYVAQTFFSMSGSSKTYRRSGGKSYGWYRSGKWVKDFTEYDTIAIENGGTGATTVGDAANNLQVPSLTQGSSLTEGTDLNDVLDVGNYRCTTTSLSNSLLNCPCAGWMFTMKVGYLPNNPSYMYQEITVFTNGEHWYRKKSGTDADWSRWISKSSYPKLTSEQKKAMKDLMAEWFKDENRNKFYYSGDIIMDEYANNNSGCYDTEKGKFKLSCSTFVQFIMMGRQVSDIVDNTTGDGYSSKITKAFDFGYYFQFKDREYIYGLTKTDDEGNLDYYGFKNPLNDETTWKGTYSKNTYYAPGSNKPKKQVFNPFAYANDMAKELWEMGCEIPVSELDIGDIVFSAGIAYENTESMFDNVAWRNITHVFMVYDIAENGELIFIECTGEAPPIIMSRRDSTYTSRRMQAVSLLKNTVMCARMPIAFGIPSNVPKSITKLKTPE